MADAPRTTRVDVVRRGRDGWGAVYGFGWIGAVVWYWQQAESFGGHIWAVLKSFVWPALLVYQALESLAQR